jgi:hypothetical protein
MEVGPVSELARQTVLVTECGRKVHTGQFVVQATAPIRWVTVAVGPDRDGAGAAWVSLTAAEALRLACALMEQADAIMSRSEGGR